METWIPITIVIVIALFIIGGLSTVHKNSSMPLRKSGLNDLKETLPRTHKTDKSEHNFLDPKQTKQSSDKKNSG